MSEPFRLALHGAGMIAGVHAAAAASAGVPVVAVASRSTERAAARATELGAAAVGYADLPGDADGVVVCSPPADHATAVARLLAAGAAVMVEKPLATTLAEADAIEAAAAAHEQRVLYAENLAYAPVVQALLAQRTMLGPLSYIEARAITGRPTWGEFLTEAWGGGVLFDLGVHPLAVALLLAGEVPVSVSAQLEGSVDGAHGTDEYATVTLRFAAGGRARVVTSWRGGADEVVWDAQAASATGVVRAELLPTPALERDGHPVTLPPQPGIEAYGYVDQLRAFVADTTARRMPFMSAAFGRTVLEVVCAAYLSAGRAGAEQSFPYQGPRDRTPLQLWRSS